MHLNQVKSELSHFQTGNAYKSSLARCFASKLFIEEYQ
jgi:hypothetical protein